MLRERFLNKNMFLRVFSSMVLLFTAYICLKEKKTFMYVLFIIYIMMLAEWMNMAFKSSNENKLLNAVMGVSLIGFSFFCCSKLFFNYYQYLVLSIIFIIITDVFAMIGGKLLMGPKLVPKISPGKTWSGLITGISACIIIFELMNFCPRFFLNYIVNLYKLANNLVEQVSCISVIILFSIISQFSDILVSYFKRKFGVKDSGKIILGHGGFLDRFDGWLLTLIFTLFSVSIVYKYFPKYII